MIEVNKGLCIYCGACVGVCPVLANKLRETWIEHDAQKCVDCGTCVKACPMAAITLHKGKKK